MKTSKFVYLFLCVVLTILQTTQNCQSQNNPKPDTTKQHPFLNKKISLKADNATFEAIVMEISKTHRVNILFDGTPAKPKTKVDIKEKPLKEALDTIGNAFDYKWTVTKTGIVLFTKSFNDPANLPQFNEEEIKQMAKDFVKTLSIAKVKPDEDAWEVEADIFLRSFTPEQIAALNERKILTGKDFTNAQREQIFTTEYYRTLGKTLVAWNLFLQQLEGYPRSHVTGLKSAGSTDQKAMAVFVFRDSADKLQTLYLKVPFAPNEVR